MDLLYFLTLWGQAAQTKNLEKLLFLQKRAFCSIHFAPYRSHAILSFNQYNILPLNFQHCKSVCTIMHDVSKNFFRLTFLTYFFTPKQVYSCYNTRFSDAGSLNIKYSTTNQLKHPFPRFGARIWNNISRIKQPSTPHT